MTKVSLCHYQLLLYITHPVFLKEQSFILMDRSGRQWYFTWYTTYWFIFCNKTEVLQQEIVERIRTNYAKEMSQGLSIFINMQLNVWSLNLNQQGYDASLFHVFVFGIECDIQSQYTGNFIWENGKWSAVLKMYWKHLIWMCNIRSLIK